MTLGPPATARRALRHLAVLALVLILPSCVTRTMYVESSPPGATVIIDGVHKGTTPFEEEFISYGTRFVELEAPGHARLHEVVELETPWWQIPPIDVVTDLLIPIPMRSDHRFEFDMVERDSGDSTRDDAAAAVERMHTFVEQFRNPPPPPE